MGAMTGRELVRVGDLHSCTLCGVPKKDHGDRFGLGHLGSSEGGAIPTTKFVAPPAELIERRAAYRMDSLTGLPLGAVSAVGEPITHLVQARCGCGSLTMATPEQSATARCSACLHNDIEERGTSRA
jgi:hypothetical protein